MIPLIKDNLIVLFLLLCICIGYEDYKQLRGFLIGTHGDTLVQFWLSLEAWQVGVVKEWWSGLCAIREQCTGVPGLFKVGLAL